MKPVLSIHEITPEILNIPREVLSEYTLTFDDGLYSQYLHWEHFKEIPTDKIFFISPGLLSTEDSSQIASISSVQAHKAFFSKNDSSAFVTLKQIQHLKRDGAVIGGHSFSHFREKNLCLDLPQPSLDSKFKYMKQDTQKMIDWFNRELHMEVEHFCFPYNNTYNGLYASMIKTLFKIPKVYGEERVLIESLL